MTYISEKRLVNTALVSSFPRLECLLIPMRLGSLSESDSLRLRPTSDLQQRSARHPQTLMVPKVSCLMPCPQAPHPQSPDQRSRPQPLILWRPSRRPRHGRYHQHALCPRQLKSQLLRSRNHVHAVTLPSNLTPRCIMYHWGQRRKEIINQSKSLPADSVSSCNDRPLPSGVPPPGHRTNLLPPPEPPRIPPS